MLKLKEAFKKYLVMPILLMYMLLSPHAPTVSEGSDGADTFVSVQASEETPNDGPKITHSTVTSHANLIPSNNIHSDKHTATL